MTNVTIQGHTFCFTGRLDHFTRDQAFDAVSERGGNVHLNITKSVDYLVVGEAPGSKLRKASNYGITKINEAQFATAVLTQSPGFISRKKIVNVDIKEPVKKVEPLKKRRFNF